MRRAMSFAVVLLGVCLVAAGAPAMRGRVQPAPAPSGEIVFGRCGDSDDCYDFDVYQVAAGGGTPRLLAHDVTAVAISPDGQRLAFARESGIRVMRRDGSQVRQVTRLFTSDLAWAPDGRALYFVQDVRSDVGTSIFSIRLDGSGLTRLTHARGEPGSHPNWRVHEDPSPSPDGRLLAFTDTPDWFAQWHTIRAVSPTGHAQALPFALPVAAPYPNTGAFAPVWSPDGRSLAYCRGLFDPRDGLRYGVYVSGPDRARPLGLALMSTEFGCSAPAWSPDGRRLAYALDHGIQLGSPDGRQPRRLVLAVAHPAGSPRWSPDGRWIGAAAGGRIWIAQADGRGRRAPVRGDRVVAWVPAAR